MKPPVPEMKSEFSDAELGDARRTKRLQQIAELAAAKPAAGLVQQATTSGVLEGTYRFLNNPAVAPEDILAAHSNKVVERTAEAGKVLVLHDTTDFRFGGDSDREGLARPKGGGKQGFLAHVSFAVSEGGRPLGTLALESWARVDTRKKPRKHNETNYVPDKESERWLRGVEACAERLNGRVEHVVHVMDREGDAYGLLAAMLDHEQRFIVRICHNRRLSSGYKWEATHLYEALAAAPVLARRHFNLSPRPLSSSLRSRYSPRTRRDAFVEIRAMPLEFSISSGSPAHFPPSLKLNVVEVRELNVPEGEPEMLWRLITTEPIATAEDVERIIDAYRMRWLIEELFKALKTGCQFERLQLETGRALQVALAIYISVAWRMLLLRWASRNVKTLPAQHVLTPAQLEVMVLFAKRLNKRLPDAPTVHEALLFIAGMGGHIPNNGEPGWQTIGTGFRDLLLMETAFLLGKQSLEKCDQ